MQNSSAPKQQHSQINDVETKRFMMALLGKLAKANQIEDELEHDLLHVPNGSDEHVLPTDLGAESLPRDVGLKLAEGEMHLIQEIEDALARLKNGNYGICESCEEEIAKRRLDVLPEARYCVRCEEEIENDFKLHAKGRVEVDFDLPIVEKRKS